MGEDTIIHARIKPRTEGEKQWKAKEELNVLDRTKNYALKDLRENSMIQCWNIYLDALVFR